ncbi:tetraacyldisaccharide 4'-kinase [Spirosoma sp. SC4-14]|uniref:tetraacyldisaccharide 4'-kinase n=1 Tax=Spirosoma sp. SC4-14 TaxID=3128900 RepID=UPI0030D127BE
MAALLLLLPFSRIYGLITDIRNWLYDRDLYAVYKSDRCVIAVGNLTVGGTGKTPMIEYLIKRYQFTGRAVPLETATLSRGYGRHTKGFRIASKQDSASTIGDEPLQLFRKFNQTVRICVGERRAEAIQKLLASYPETNRILLDDAFQHRAVKPQFNLLLTDYNRPFYTDHPFPAGRLRERRHGARRADAVVVTKCPLTLSDIEQNRIRESIRVYARSETPVFFAGLQYSFPVPFSGLGVFANLDRVMLVSGLGNADPLEQYVSRTFRMRTHHRFADHYAYSRSELDQLLAALQPGESLLTTEKDWVKLSALLKPDELNRLPLYYLPVEMAFLDNSKTEFDRLVDEIPFKKR